jgi:hypothetical protein
LAFENRHLEIGRFMERATSPTSKSHPLRTDNSHLGLASFRPIIILPNRGNPVVSKGRELAE